MSAFHNFNFLICNGKWVNKFTLIFLFVFDQVFLYYFQEMIFHDKLESRKIERVASENGGDFRKPIFTSIQTSITPPGLAFFY